MVPQQAHYQFRWLKVFRAHLDLSICDLLSAICHRLLAIPSTFVTAAGDHGVPGAVGVSL
jgi:hypothetical protein